MHFCIFAFAFAKNELIDAHPLPLPWKAQPTSKIFTPLQTHGMEKITAWRRREISFAMQKKREYYHLIGLSQ